MKQFTNLFTLIMLIMMLMFKLAHTNAIDFNDVKSSLTDSSASDETDGLERDKKDASALGASHGMTHPVRRHHLKFGVLGKRYSYGYLGRRNDVQNDNDEYQEWLNEMRQRRAGRPQYGLLG